MKINMREFDGCFCFDFTAENLQEAALLTRFGSNSTNQITHKATNVSSVDGIFTTAMVFGKGKKTNSEIANWHRKDKS